MVHPYEDSESSEDEVDWQDTRHDPYRAGELPYEVGGASDYRRGCSSVPVIPVDPTHTQHSKLN